jgi:2-polyprenyl-6-methoxyphenol hydroxylase-like FAD-dependent oxidoreductase
VRGTALDVVDRMGILPNVREAQVDIRRSTFLDADGSEVASVPAHTVTGSVAGRDVEIRRGDLTQILYRAVRDDMEIVFDDSIETLDQSGHGVDVTFRSGATHTFDLVFGADGVHSPTRRFLFGPEEQYHRYLGYCFAVFDVPNTFGLSSESVVWNSPGRAAALYAVEDDEELHALLNFARPEPPVDVLGDREARQKLFESVYADAGWEVPSLLAALRESDDAFFDTVGQIHLPRWSSGRVALVGDAAYAPSFLTGQGTSIALVGAYMLAASLADGDHVAGFAAYERDTRDFVTQNQALVGKGEAALFPVTRQDLERRNSRLRTLSSLPVDQGRPAHTALTLPPVRLG